MIRNLAADVRAFTSNAFLVAGERTVLVDPGNEFDVVSRVRDATGGLDAVVLTHTHSDHVGNVDAVTEAFDVEVRGFDPDNDLVDHAIADGDTVVLGDHDYTALHTPGHKDDHLCFVRADGEVAVVGDLVFSGGGFGRTDLEEGDRPRLVESIEYLLAETDDSLAAMHAGHGPSVEANARQHIEYALRAARSR
ncbi:MBL fold metallo-hydrolase [Halosegnis marinus]|uniref:MBL fold metallo-hydrolase n=1 Tax=Halosegnis marinus TaxID=3034023 RepID=A0ABD5ZRP3_9EURY|nr:MBL fold metallo-hydrolase [Halosegnis sp. DT85]